MAESLEKQQLNLQSREPERPGGSYANSGGEDSRPASAPTEGEIGGATSASEDTLYKRSRVAAPNKD